MDAKGTPEGRQGNARGTPGGHCGLASIHNKNAIKFKKRNKTKKKESLSKRKES